MPITVYALALAAALFDSATTYMGLTYTDTLRESHWFSGWLLGLGSFPPLLVVKLGVVLALVGLSAFVYRKFGSRLAVYFLLIPCTATMTYAGANNLILIYGG